MVALSVQLAREVAGWIIGASLREVGARNGCFSAGGIDGVDELC